MKQAQLRQKTSQRTFTVARPKPTGEAFPLLDIVFMIPTRGSTNFTALHNTGRASNLPVQSANMDPNFPRFGPWSMFPVDDPLSPQAIANTNTTLHALSPMQMVKGYTDNTYWYQPGNLTYPTDFGGPPIVNDYACQWNNVYDVPAWTWNIPARPDALPVPPNAPIAPFTAPTIAGGTYNPLSVTNPTVMPAPNEIADQTVSGWSDAAGHQFGDKWALKTAAPSSPPVAADYAATVADVVNFMKTSGVDPANLGTIAAITAMNSMFNDPVTYSVPNAGQWWQKFGYGQNNAAKAFYGYTMGPGYYGKTFFMWPPDPRTPSDNGSIAPPSAGESTGPGSAAVTRGYIPGDWRQRFFQAPNTSDLDLWNTVGRWIGTSGGSQPNYTAVIQWILGGPQVFPPNLRNGRVVFYTAIPTTIVGNTPNEVFWRSYIDYVLGTGPFSESRFLYGTNVNAHWQRPDLLTTANWGTGTGKITDPAGLQNPGTVTYLSTTVVQSMYYDDMPIPPRTHFWFGPLSLIAFLQLYLGGDGSGLGNSGSFESGNTHSGPLWQFKASIEQALKDIKVIAPNSRVSLVFYSTINVYNQPRAALTRNFDFIKNFLYYPYSIPSPTTVAVSTASWSANVVSLTTVGNHNLVTNQNVTIASVSPGGYNGVFTVTVTGATTFTYPLFFNPGSYSSGGTVALNIPPDQYLPDETQQLVPYNISGSSLADINGGGLIPNSGGSGAPSFGYKEAYNQFSQSSVAQAGGPTYLLGGQGRVGKKLLFDIAAVFLNSQTSGTFVPGGRGKSYYSDNTTVIYAGGLGNGDYTFDIQPTILNMLDPVNGFGADVAVQIFAFGDNADLTSGAPTGSVNLFLNQCNGIQGVLGGKSLTQEPWRVCTGTVAQRLAKLRAGIQRVLKAYQKVR